MYNPVRIEMDSDIFLVVVFGIIFTLVIIVFLVIIVSKRKRITPEELLAILTNTSECCISRYNAAEIYLEENFPRNKRIRPLIYFIEELFHKFNKSPTATYDMCLALSVNLLYQVDLTIALHAALIAQHDKLKPIFTSMMYSKPANYTQSFFSIKKYLSSDTFHFLKLASLTERKKFVALKGVISRMKNRNKGCSVDVLIKYINQYGSIAWNHLRIRKEIVNTLRSHCNKNPDYIYRFFSILDFDLYKKFLRELLNFS